MLISTPKLHFNLLLTSLPQPLAIQAQDLHGNLNASERIAASAFDAQMMLYMQEKVCFILSVVWDGSAMLFIQISG